MLYETFKRAYHNIIYTNRSELCIKKLEIADEKTRFNLQMKKGINVYLYSLIFSFILFQKRKLRRMTFSPQEVSEYLKKLPEYNPLIRFFFTRITLYTWRNYTDIVFEKLIQINLQSNVFVERKEQLELISEYSENNIISETSSDEEEDTINKKVDSHYLGKERVHCPSFDEHFKVIPMINLE